MNKLVSRNPILRFKLGKKIEKFLGGGLKTYGGLPIESIENRRGFYTLNGTLYSVPVSLFDTSKDYQFMGTKIGGKVLAKKNNFGDRLTDENKLKLLDSGFFKESDFSNVSAFQNALNHYFGKDGYGTIKVDNMWGNQTLKAFDFALGKVNSPRVMGGISDPVITLAKLTPVSTPNITIPDQLPQINVLIPLKTFNRSDIRQYIKGKGFDPYLFTGSQRKALRMVMNGTGTDEDLNIAKSMGVFKKGGILKFLNAGNLPTAPKAEDRYKYSFKSSEVTPEGEEIKTVKVAPTGYWKFPATILQRVNSQNDTTYIEVPTHTNILGGFMRPRVYARTVIKNANLPYNIGTYLTFTPSFVGPLFSPSNKLEYETLKRRFNTAWNLAK